MNVADAVMIGDDAIAGVEGSLRAGLRGVLVQTGKYQPGDAQRIALPAAVMCAYVGEAVRRIVEGGLLATTAPAGARSGTPM